MAALQPAEYGGVLMRRLARIKWLARVICHLWMALLLSTGYPVRAQSPPNQPEDQIRLKLRYLGNAFQNRHTVLNSFAPAGVADGKPNGAQLSWRVHLLPFIGEPELFEEFHFDESWDSPHNKSLLVRMPAVYSTGEAGFSTRFQVFQGKSLLFGGSQAANRQMLRDSPAGTIMIVVTAADKAVPWTQPDDLAFIPQAPAEPLGKVETIECVMADSRLVSLPSSMTASDLAGLITPAGAEVVDVEKYRVEVKTILTPEMQAAMAKLKERRDVMGRLKGIGGAMRSYHDTFNTYPVTRQPAYYQESGQPKLSWRVHLLPFLEQKELFDKFKLDEPWDSPNNLPLLQKMPPILGDISDKPGETRTRFVVVRGKGALFDGNQPPKRRTATDGTGYTALVVRVGTDKSAPWTKPDDAEFDPQNPKSLLGKIEDTVYILTMDGAVKALKSSLSDDLFRGLMTATGGEVLNESELQTMTVR